MKSEAIAWLALLALALSGLTVWWWTRPADAGRHPVDRIIPDFALVERSGKTIRRADLLGSVSVVDFFYTRCTEACPLLSAYMERLQADPSLPSGMLLVSITVDPDHDTPDVLSAYARQFHADSRKWLFLTGPRTAIYSLAVDGFGLAALVSRPMRPAPAWSWLGPGVAFAHEESNHANVIQLVHASRFAVVDREGRIRDYVDGGDPSAVVRLRQAVLRVLDEPSASATFRRWIGRWWSGAH